MWLIELLIALRARGDALPLLRPGQVNFAASVNAQLIGQNRAVWLGVVIKGAVAYAYVGRLLSNRVFDRRKILPRTYGQQAKRNAEKHTGRRQEFSHNFIVVLASKPTGQKAPDHDLAGQREQDKHSNHDDGKEPTGVIVKPKQSHRGRELKGMAK